MGYAVKVMPAPPKVPLHRLLGRRSSSRSKFSNAAERKSIFPQVGCPPRSRWMQRRAKRFRPRNPPRRLRGSKSRSMNANRSGTALKLLRVRFPCRSEESPMRNGNGTRRKPLPLRLPRRCEQSSMPCGQRPKRRGSCNSSRSIKSRAEQMPLRVSLPLSKQNSTRCGAQPRNPPRRRSSKSRCLIKSETGQMRLRAK